METPESRVLADIIKHLTAQTDTYTVVGEQETNAWGSEIHLSFVDSEGRTQLFRIQVPKDRGGSQPKQSWLPS